MQIILKQDVKSLGYKYDIITVKNGYGLNYLIPQGLAAVATESAVKVRNENVRQAAFKQDKLRNEAQATADKLAAITLNIAVKAGENGRLFGTVTTTQVAEALMAQGIEIDRRRISFNADVKEVGSHEAEVDLHREVKGTIKVEVSAAE
jgi:large subunit ribosomal protein L9